jgi:hypothetical protein
MLNHWGVDSSERMESVVFWNMTMKYMVTLFSVTLSVLIGCNHRTDRDLKEPLEYEVSIQTLLNIIESSPIITRCAPTSTIFDLDSLTINGLAFTSSPAILAPLTQTGPVTLVRNGTTYPWDIVSYSSHVNVQFTWQSESLTTVSFQWSDDTSVLRFSCFEGDEIALSRQSTPSTIRNYLGSPYFEYGPDGQDPIRNDNYYLFYEYPSKEVSFEFDRKSRQLLGITVNFSHLAIECGTCRWGIGLTVDLPPPPSTMDTGSAPH